MQPGVDLGLFGVVPRLRLRRPLSTPGVHPSGAAELHEAGLAERRWRTPRQRIALTVPRSQRRTGHLVRTRALAHTARIATVVTSEPVPPAQTYLVAVPHVVSFGGGGFRL